MVSLSINVQLNVAAYNSFKDDFIAANPSYSDPIYHIYLAHDAVKSLALAFHNIIERGVADGVAYWDDGDEVLSEIRTTTFEGVSGEIG